MSDSTDDRRPDRTSVADERGNPFVTFTRLVDQQVSNLFRTFTDFPSNLARSRYDRSDSAEQQRRWREAKEEAEEFERSFHELFAPLQDRGLEKTERSFDDRPHPHLKKEPVHWEIERPCQAGSKEQEEPLNTMSERLASWNLQNRIREEGENLHQEYEEAERVMDCIRDRMCQLFQEKQHQDCPYRPADEDLDEELRNTFVGTFIPSLRWALPKSCSANYFLESPYSPFNLENDDPFREHRAKWRKAFEDLLLVSHGKDLSENTSQDEHKSVLDWKDSLVERGLIGYDPLGMKKVPTDQFDECATRQPENDASEDAETELDLCKLFLGSRRPAARGNTSNQTFATNANANAEVDSDKPSLISTLTTTERRTLPDGSVYTQVVLKKRFSDGREESTETEHTTHGTHRPELRKQITQGPKGSSTSSAPSLGYDGKVKQALGQKIEEQKKRGWFWS
ncbi:MAG: hypothetical protein LQ338_005721 [Usnochroma carphineum]|nr:MAG: hypothetical protein LQ338_005721 [Usnochroma carphineum]